MALVLVAGLAGCAAPSIDQFAGTAPAFDPIRFFNGHVTSWGVIENRSGAPTGVITTDCVGMLEGANGLHMVQTLTQDGDRRVRDWHLHRVTPTHFEATANDVVGLATGDIAGRAFHWRYVLALQPGNHLKDVSLDQWMYAMADGSMVNRATISKFGVILAEVTEHFAHAGEPPIRSGLGGSISGSE